MKSYFRRWLPVIMQNRVKSAALGLAGLAMAGGVVGGAVSAAGAGSEATTTATTVAAVADAGTPASAAAGLTFGKPAAKVAAAPKAAAMPSAKSLKHGFQLQPNYYYCGPAATRVALSAHGKTFSQDHIAGMLGTTTSGTNSAEDITRVLNSALGKGRYHTVEIPAGTASAKHVARLKADVVTAINQGDPVVANVAGAVTDRDGQAHSYEGGHYLTVVGYSGGGNIVTIADSADTVGSAHYTLNVTHLANWIASRGYAA